MRHFEPSTPVALQWNPHCVLALKSSCASMESTLCARTHELTRLVTGAILAPNSRAFVKEALCGLHGPTYRNHPLACPCSEASVCAHGPSDTRTVDWRRHWRNHRSFRQMGHRVSLPPSRLRVAP
eukprot:scaffold104802_cov31-Tisochrysis_lutea.AAC.2